MVIIIYLAVLFFPQQENNLIPSLCSKRPNALQCEQLFSARNKIMLQNCLFVSLLNV